VGADRGDDGAVATVGAVVVGVTGHDGVGAGADTGSDTGSTGRQVLADALLVVRSGLVLLGGNTGRDTGGEGQDGDGGCSEVHFE
jgi:hypothetical protein